MAFSMKLPAKKQAAPKQYGLILPTKKAAGKELKPAFNVFGSDPDAGRASVEDTSKAAERRRVGEEAARSYHQAQVDRTHQKALAEDATVFDYDGVYEQIQSARLDKATRRKEQREAEKKQPRYITTLMEKAKVREIEHERIRERRLLKEREAEDSLYGDKEKFVSASYKRKLMDMKRWDEEDARLDAVEAAEDVAKRGETAMAGFYSNLITKNIAMGGAASNSRSAYTVGKDDVTQRKESTPQLTEQATASLGQRAGPASPVRSADNDHGESERKRSRTESGVEVVASSEAESTGVEHGDTAPPVVEPPKPSKEEAISAAKARYLARKAMRAQETTAESNTNS